MNGGVFRQVYIVVVEKNSHKSRKDIYNLLRFLYLWLYSLWHKP